MIFQWYSGSDKSGRIPRRLNELLYHLRDTLPHKVLVRELELLAEEEKDPNMRAKILIAIGRLFGHAGDFETRLRYCERAAALFDFLAGNFLDVVQEYVEANNVLAGREADASGKPTTLFDDVPYVFATIVWGDNGRQEEDDRMLALGLLANFFRECADVFGHPVFAQLSLIAASRRHHGDPEHPLGLLQLAHALGRLGDKEGTRRVLEMLKEVDHSGECYREALESWGNDNR